MRLVEYSGLGLVAALALCACAQRIEEEPLPPGVEEIPVTTKSWEALAKFRKGQKHLDVGRNRQANPIFENATGKDPRFSYAYLNAAITAASVREFTDYLKLATTYIIDKSEGERLLVEIAHTYVNKDTARRLELGKSLSEAYPRSRRAWLTLAEVQTGLEQYQAARESLAKALELDPGLIATHVAIWRSYLFRQPTDHARAEQAMKQCIEIDPAEAKCDEYLADVYRAANELGKARESYSRAAEKDPALSAAMLKKGHANSFLGNFEEARADYQAAIEVARDQSRLNYASYLAFIHLYAGDYQAAVDELSALLVTVDDSGIPRHQVAGVKSLILGNRSAIELHHGLLDEAEKTIVELAAAERSVAEQANSPSFTRQREGGILLREGRLAALRGDYQLADAKAEEYRQLLEADSDLNREPRYHGLLGQIELLRSKPQQAVEHLRQADLTDIYLKYQLALAEEAAGNLEEAKRLFAEVASWNFNTVGCALVRGDAMERL